MTSSSIWTKIQHITGVLKLKTPPLRFGPAQKFSKSFNFCKKSWINLAKSFNFYTNFYPFLVVFPCKTPKNTSKIFRLRRAFPPKSFNFYKKSQRKFGESFVEGGVFNFNTPVSCFYCSQIFAFRVNLCSSIVIEA